MKDDNYPIKLFAALANPTRWKMPEFLEKQSVRSIGELGRTFQISHVAATKHVQVLEKANLISRKNVGKFHNIEINTLVFRAVKELLA